MTTLVALMACHNRREKTLASIERYYACDVPAGCIRKLVLVDDGSTDGTTEAVHTAYPEVIIEQGDGSLFWNRGMLRAWQRALPLEPDYVLWLNDDTLLYPQALTSLLETEARIRAETGQPGIVVGSTDNDAGELSYGGSVPASPLNRLKMRKVVPGDAPRPAVTMNGNCVLVPRAVSDRIGLLDSIYRHAMGDNDYGFRAHKAGIPIWVMPGYAGRCNNDNRVAGGFNDRSLPLRTRWKKITSPKGLPFDSWRALCSRHAGPAWPLVWLLPYTKLILSAATQRASGSR
ncbi:MAG: glycosyltransferase family 2 protein [Thiobacillus sp.]|nr:glycosyltransferase family 2 protein [Thiobacillus sp.]